MGVSIFRTIQLNEARWALSATLALAIGCGSEDSSSSNKNAAGTGGFAGEAGAQPLMGTCPNGFTPKSGTNTGFPSDGKDRMFHLTLPADTATTRPIFVALTGTVQEEVSFTQQSGLSELPGSGWIVATPVRSCSQNGTDCFAFPATEADGRIWEPWYDGAAAARDDEGPDVRFVESMVRCIASEWPVDQRRIYVGGVSAGGSFTNRSMAFNSDFFAGGVVSSGNWYGGLVTPGTPRTMDPSIVIISWGGPNDAFPPSPPYSGETKAASEFFAQQPNVLTVSCSGTAGHIWPTAMTPWFIQTLLSYPKGSDPKSFTLTTPPAGFSCVAGVYTDH